MKGEQYENLMGLLTEIRDRLPETGKKAPEPPVTLITNPLDGIKTLVLNKEEKVAASLALYTLMTVLDGWIEGAQCNHQALEHRENIGQECWRSFAPADIRAMINDAARDLDLGEFPDPSPLREDVKL